MNYDDCDSKGYDVRGAPVTPTRGRRIVCALVRESVVEPRRPVAPPFQWFEKCRIIKCTIGLWLLIIGLFLIRTIFFTVVITIIRVRSPFRPPPSLDIPTRQRFEKNGSGRARIQRFFQKRDVRVKKNTNTNSAARHTIKNT